MNKNITVSANTSLKTSSIVLDGVGLWVKNDKNHSSKTFYLTFSFIKNTENSIITN